MNPILTPDELDLLIDIVTLHQKKIEDRSHYIIHAVTINYYKKRLKRVKDLNHKLMQVQQELKLIRLKAHRDAVGRIVDPDLCRP